MKQVMFGIGSVLAVGALLSTAGCKTEVMKDEYYVPARQEALPAPAAMAPAVEATEIAPAEVAAPAEIAAPAPKTYKRFDSSSIKPAKRRPAASKHKVAAVKAGGTYVVKSGDTLSHIALAHRIRVADIRNANSLKSDVIRVGQKLVIPGKGAAVKSSKSAKPAAAAAPAAAPALTEGGFYVLKKGDNIPKIARRFGVKESDLKAANNLTDEATRRLQIGQKLVIPGKGGAAAATTAAAAPATPAPGAGDVSAQVSAAADSVIDALPETTAPAAAPAAAPANVEAAPAVVAPVEAAPVEAVAPAAQGEVVESTVADFMEKGVRLGDYLKQKNLTLETFKKYNPSVLASFTKVGDNELDYVAAEDGLMVFIPEK